MADEVKKDEPKEVVDVFGDKREAETGAPVVPEVPVEEKKEEGKKDDTAKTDDLEKNPLVVQLRKDITDLSTNLEKESGDKKSMGENLSAMRKRLEKLEKGDKEGAAEPVFKKEEIKRVKDYSKEEQDEMTPAFKEQVEANADMKERINKLVADQTEGAAKTAADGEKAAEELEAQEEFEKTAQAVSLKLAGNDKDMANKILVEFNQFANNDKLDEKGIEERMAKAAKLVSDYKPPKEQTSQRGGAAPANDNAADPHGVDKIIEGVQQSRKGGTYTL